MRAGPGARRPRDAAADARADPPPQRRQPVLRPRAGPAVGRRGRRGAATPCPPASATSSATGWPRCRTRARTHLRQAAVLGQEVDLDVLIALAGDEDAVLDAVESALRAGFLVERDAGPPPVRPRAGPRHALRRHLRAHAAPRWHAAVAERDRAPAARRRRGDRPPPPARREPATAARAARYARAAAERAERRFAPHEAARLWRETVAALDRAGEPDARARLEAVMGLVRALAVTGDLAAGAAAPRRGDHRGRGARRSRADRRGDRRLRRARDLDDQRRRGAVRRASSRRPSARWPRCRPDAGAERARLLTTIAMERRADAGDARRARRRARRRRSPAGSAIPALLAFALNGRFMQTLPARRARAASGPDRRGAGRAGRRGTAW